MTFRIQDLMIDALPGTPGNRDGRRQPGQLLCGTTSCAKSTTPSPEPPPEEPEDPTAPCGTTSCGKSIAVYQTAPADLAALRRQLQSTLAGM
jgi:hypothetical protein